MDTPSTNMQVVYFKCVQIRKHSCKVYEYCVIKMGNFYSYDMCIRGVPHRHAELKYPMYLGTLEEDAAISSRFLVHDPLSPLPLLPPLFLLSSIVTRLTRLPSLFHISFPLNPSLVSPPLVRAKRGLLSLLPSPLLPPPSFPPLGFSLLISSLQFCRVSHVSPFSPLPFSL